MNRYEAIMERCRYHRICMNEGDLTELYSYLELFHDTLSVCESEVEIVMKAVKELYMLVSNITDEKNTVMVFKNPWNAGRKKQYTEEDRQRIIERSISEELGISKSTVQRMFHSNMS